MNINWIKSKGRPWDRPRCYELCHLVWGNKYLLTVVYTKKKNEFFFFLYNIQETIISKLHGASLELLMLRSQQSSHPSLFQVTHWLKAYSVITSVAILYIQNTYCYLNLQSLWGYENFLSLDQSIQNSIPNKPFCQIQNSRTLLLSSAVPPLIQWSFTTSKKCKIHRYRKPCSSVFFWS